MGFREKLRFSRRNKLLALLGAALILGGGTYWIYAPGATTAADGDKAGPRSGGAGGEGKRRSKGGGNRVQPVKVVEAKRGDLEVVLTALGTVTSSNTATIRPRVDGQLMKVRFREGQLVKPGDVLAEIDPRPFQIQVDQVHGQLLKDQALLSNAQVDLERYRGLLAKESIARQQVDAQEALVRQYQGTVETDKAQEANARLQLAWTHISAPVPGRVGLRLADAGNMVRASDASGLVVITQTQPIHVVFSIPADSIGAVVNKLQDGKTRLPVEVRDRDGKVILASGKLLSADNQIDVTTGTVKLKAEFANKDNTLFPNQFVNAILKVETRHDSILLPAAAVQRNTRGTFVFVVKAEDQTVSIRPVVLGATSGETVAIESGLEAGEQVVLDGTDRLRPGAKVEVVADSRGEGKGNGEGRHRKNGGDAPPAAGSESAPRDAANTDRSTQTSAEGRRQSGKEKAVTAAAAPAAGTPPERTDVTGKRAEWTPPKDETEAERQARRERFRQMREAAGESGGPGGAVRRRSE